MWLPQSVQDKFTHEVLSLLYNICYFRNTFYQVNKLDKTFQPTEKNPLSIAISKIILD